MAHWNHRVMRSLPDHAAEPVYTVHEVYYDDDGNVEGWTEKPIAPVEDNIVELQETLMRMVNACAKPVLDYETGRTV